MCHHTQLRVVAAAPNAACQGQPAARPRPARPPSPGRPHFRPSGQSQSPGHGGDASRSAAPSRTEVGPQTPFALVRTGWLCSRARPRQAGPCGARSPFPWQQRELRRPTAAKPRASLRRAMVALGGVCQVPPDSTACPFFIFPHNLLQRKSTFLPPPIHNFSSNNSTLLRTCPSFSSKLLLGRPQLI